MMGLLSIEFYSNCMYFLYPLWAFMHILSSSRDLKLFQPNNTITTSRQEVDIGKTIPASSFLASVQCPNGNKYLLTL